MKTLSIFKKISAAIIGAMILVSVSAAQASPSFKHKAKASERTEAFHKALEEKGYAHINEMSVSKSDIQQTKYFVNFVNDGSVYDAYFTKKGALVEVYKVAQL